MGAAEHEQVQGRLRGGDGAEGERQIARARHQFQHSPGDDAESAFGSDEELAETVSGVVFAQAPQSVPDCAVGQDDLETENEVARVAEAQRVVAAGVGGEHAADLR